MKIQYVMLNGIATMLLSSALYAADQTADGVTVGQPTNPMQTDQTGANANNQAPATADSSQNQMNQTTPSTTMPDANSQSQTMPSTAAAPSATMNSTATDADITFNVQKQLNGDSTLSGSNITATVSDGVVTLSGSAKNQAQVDHATDVAKSINGVKNVLSTVNVQGGTTGY
jgi:osmotically-inducible protein OsmY